MKKLLFNQFNTCRRFRYNQLNQGSILAAHCYGSELNGLKGQLEYKRLKILENGAHLQLSSQRGRISEKSRRAICPNYLIMTNYIVKILSCALIGVLTTEYVTNTQ